MNNSTKEDETNASTQNLNIVPLPHDNNQFEINVMGNMSDINFYLPDENGDTTGIAFRIAYRSAKYHSKNIKELCTYIGSMLCAVVPGFRNSVEKSLYGIGVRPRFVSLPSQANEKNIVISDVPQLDWSSILVVFGYCIVLLFKHNAVVGGYSNYISNYICQLQAKVRWDSSNKLDIPFDATQANLVRTMFDSPDLRATMVAFLVKNSSHPDSQIRNVCQYLSINLISFV